MRRRSVLALTGSALMTTLAGCNALDGSPEPTDTPTDSPDVPSDLVNGGFENDWAGLTVGRDLPVDPNRKGDRKVASETGVTTRKATDGTTSLRLFIDGSQDHGTVWVQHPVDLSAYDYLAVDYAVSMSFNVIRKAAVYAGPQPEKPLTEADFDTSSPLEGLDTSSWKTLTFDIGYDGPGLVAVGFSVVWETGIQTLLDHVRLSADPPSTMSPSPPTDSGREEEI